MLPFRPQLRPGEPVYLEIVEAVKKALARGAMKPGDPFPSVRAISLALKINPNTAHKALSVLAAEGVIEIRPGQRALVAEQTATSAASARLLLRETMDSLLIEAARLGVDWSVLVDALEKRRRQLFP